MSSDSYLQNLVIARCKELGDAPAAEFFGVSPALVRQWVNGSKSPSLAAVEKVFVMPDVPTSANWEGKEVFIAAPFYRTTNPRTMFSLLAMWERPKYGYRHRFGDAYIEHARNQLADDFIASGLPICQWVDDDSIPPCGVASWYIENTKIPCPPEFAARHGINRLRSHNLSLVGGLYYGRWEHGRATYAEAAISDVEDRKSRQYLDIVQPTEWVGTGFLQTKREVFLDIQKAHPHIAPQHPGESWQYFAKTADHLVRRFAEIQALADSAAEALPSSSESAGKLVKDIATLVHTAYEEFLRLDRLPAGEDQTFCKRAKAAGHQPHVDLGCIVGHCDGAVVYGPHNTGKYANS